MPLCTRLVDSDKEEFIQFYTLVRVTAEVIATQTCTDIKKLDLDINIRVQGYDGASNMSSDRTGVQAHIIPTGNLYSL